MCKRSAILVLVLLVSYPAFGASKAGRGLLRDGFVLAGVDGKLVGDSNDRWFFKFDSDVNDNTCIIKAGTAIEMLPSVALEKMVANMKMRTESSYRLYRAIVTRYKGKNFIFPAYFLPVSEVKKPRQQTSDQQQTRTRVNEPNDTLTIPKKIMDKFRNRKIVRPAKVQKGLVLKQDFVLADRTAILVSDADGRSVFTLDALGRNIQRASFQLLPCRTLEVAEQKQAGELEQLRFKIAGIVTRYKGRDYLLLQRVRRVYSHENFPR